MGLFYIYTLLHGTFNVHLEVNILLGLDNSILNIPYWDFKYEHNLQGLWKVDMNITYWDIRRFRKTLLGGSYAHTALWDLGSPLKECFCISKNNIKQLQNYSVSGFILYCLLVYSNFEITLSLNSEIVKSQNIVLLNKRGISQSEESDK